MSLFNKQGPLRRQREQSHLKTKLGVSAIISRLFHVVCLEKCVQTNPELNSISGLKPEIWKLVVKYSGRVYRSKTGHFTAEMKKNDKH